MGGGLGGSVLGAVRLGGGGLGVGRSRLEWSGGEGREGGNISRFFPFPTLFTHFFDLFMVFRGLVLVVWVLCFPKTAQNIDLEREPNVCFAQFLESKAPKPSTQVHEKP